MSGNHNMEENNENIVMKDKQMCQYFRKEITTVVGKRSLIKPIIGMFFILSMFTLWILGLVLFFKGNFAMKFILLLLVLYQFSIKAGSQAYRDFLKRFKIFDYFKSYTIIIEEEISKNKSLLCHHPHGIISVGLGLALLSNIPVLSEIVTLASSLISYMPLSGILIRLVGFEGAENQNFKRLMSEGKNIFFIPGGFECATITNHRKDRVFIKKRKGFIKYALEYGYKVYPCYTFNENKTFYTFNFFEEIRLILNKIKIPGCLAVGKLLFFPLNDVDLCLVIGKSLDLPLIKNPTKEDIDKYHMLYINSLKTLYNTYKKEFRASYELELL